MRIDLATTNLISELELEVPTVDHAGERVVVGEVAELVLQALARVDVLDLREAIQGLPVVVADERGRQRRPHFMAFGVSQAKLAMEDVDLAVQKRTQALVDLGEVVPVEKLGQGPHADELDRGVAGQVGERLVDADDRLGALTVGRHDRHADGGVLEAEPEALLGCAGTT